MNSGSLGWLTLAVVCLVLLGGCASMATSPGNRAAVEQNDLNNCDRRLGSDDLVALSAVHEEIRGERYHAALAKLDELPRQAVGVRYWQAEANRRLGQARAETQFRSLLGTCMNGLAQHGLGLVQVTRGDVEAGVESLAAARRQHPASSHVRSDYGYALLRAGRPEQAVFELKTALELNPDNDRALGNLLLGLLLQEEVDQVAAIVSEYRVDGTRLQHIRGRVPEMREYWVAQQLREESHEDHE